MKRFNDDTGKKKKVFEKLIFCLLGFLSILQFTNSVTVLDSVIGTNENWVRVHSPYLAKLDTVIQKDVTVTVEPGVIIMFAPGVLFKVDGKLVAKGTPDERIIFTKVDPTGTRPILSPTHSDPPIVPKRLKLVDGEEIRDGKLHIFYQNRWRPVCSQNREWSKADSVLACQELGFKEGNFTSLSLAENSTHHALYAAPGCHGNESSLLECSGAKNILLGSDICNLQEVVGLVCWGANMNLYGGHWHGMEFYNTTVKEVRLSTVNTKLNVSDSTLEYVDILFAGVNKSEHSVASISASPFPPILDNVRVAYSAYDGVNFTELTGSAIIRNTKVEGNRGHGMNITTNIGYIRVSNVTALDNGGDGAYLRLRQHHWPESASEIVDKAVQMCKPGALLGSPLFPFMLVGEMEVPDMRQEYGCSNLITTDDLNQIITVTLLEVLRDPNATTVVNVMDELTGISLALWTFDGPMERWPDGKLAPVKLYQGVSSARNRLRVEFRWKKPENIGSCSTFAPCARVIMQISVGETTNPEVQVSNSLFQNNQQRGLRIENPWTYVRILDSTFSLNKWDAGLKVVNGSADLFVNASSFLYNERCGLNITTAGGFRIVNASRFISNQGHGMDVWNPTWLMTRRVSSNLRTNITTHVHTSLFRDNLWNGIRFYNSCLPMNILVNYSRFESNGHSGIETYTCLFPISLSARTNFSVGYSTFLSNRWNAIQIQPMTNMVGHVTNSTFTNHRRGVILVENTANFILIREYRTLGVDYSIYFNDFMENTGPFVVNARLSQGSPMQSLKIIFNRFTKNNIQRAGQVLNPRSSAHAVVIIGSSNCQVQRNELRNPASTYEISTHLEASDQMVEARRNFWGTQADWGGIAWSTIIETIFGRIFGQVDRYTLATIVYVPLLKENNLQTNYFTDDPEYTHQFRKPGSQVIGGRLNMEQKQEIVLERNDYKVTRDIFVPFGAKLTIQEGAKLNFENSVGLFIQGEISMIGSAVAPIDMVNIPVPPVNTTSEEYLNDTTSAWVRLVDGTDETTGLVQIRFLTNATGFPADMSATWATIGQTKDDWGYVCASGFDARAASIVCNALGMVAVPKDWDRVDPISPTTPPHLTRVHMSDLHCSDWDQTLMDCQYDAPLDHTCLSSGGPQSSFNTAASPGYGRGLAGVRCRQAGWAGVRSSMSGVQGYLSYVNLRGGGHFDYFHMKYGPALQIDYNIYVINNLQITGSLSHGLAIMHNNVMAPGWVTKSNFSNNLGDGFITRCPWLAIDNSFMTHNGGAGFRYDPVFRQQMVFQLKAEMVKTLYLLKTGVANNYLKVHPSGTEFVVLSEGTSDESMTYYTEISSTDATYQQQLLVDLIDFPPNNDIMNITIFDTGMPVKEDRSTFWQIPRDANWFPLRSTGTKLTVKIVVNGTRTGRLAFTVQAHQFDVLNNVYQTSRYYPPTSLTIDRTELSYNAESGLVMKHYNDPSNRDGDIFLRRQRENIALTDLTVSFNGGHSLHVPSVSRFEDDWFAPAYAESIEGSSRISRVYYRITNCKWIGNRAGGLLAEHNHVQFANNVFDYVVDKVEVRGSLEGGWVMSLPFVSSKFDWRYEPQTSHSITISNTTFLDNQQFEFDINGFLTNLVITQNQFLRNRCKLGLISLRDMEKNLTLSSNMLKDNLDCRHVIQMYITSQMESSDVVPAVIERNTITGNVCPELQLDDFVTEAFPCFTIGIFGSQNVTIKRNILSNQKPGYLANANLYITTPTTTHYEIVSGVVSVDLTNFLDCRENYWGTVDPKVIRKFLIFDMDKWNSFARVLFADFLMVADMNTMDLGVGDSSEGQGGDTRDVTKAFGGRITKDLLLTWRPTPYEISADLTVMPGVTLYIEAGVHLQFHPNVGLLVLGRLLARGMVNRPILMTGLPPPSSPPATVQRKKRQASDDSTYIRPSMYSEAANSGKASVEPGRITLQADGIRLIGGLETGEGFVQFYNATAQRWDLSCDSQFSYQVGQVVCRQLNRTTHDVIVRFTHLYDHYVYGFENWWVVKYIWMTSYTCWGGERNLAQCTRRLNYDALRCSQRAGYVFLRCGEPTLPAGQRYWGNVRIASTLLEQTTPTSDDQSEMEHVKISEAGILHGEPVAAIQTTYAYPSFSFVEVFNCASNGFDIVAPRGYLQTFNTTVHNNLGYGFGMLILNGDSLDPTLNQGQLTQYVPLIESTLPYNMLGLLDMCDSKKTYEVVDRLIVYYKYSYQTRACTKRFVSKVPGKLVALRFLQLNLYHDPFTKNTVEIFNGNFFNITEIIREVTALNTADDGSRRRTYVTSRDYDIMGVHVHASPAKDSYGFTAEIITLPLSPDKTYPDLNKKMEHLIQDCEFRNNQGGGLHFAGVGEINPDLTIYYNRFHDNGLSILNLTSPPSINILLQNSRNLDLTNNLVQRNRGGVRVWLHADSLSKGARANITNNVISGITHDGALWMTGNHFNTLRVLRNFITHNDCEMRDVIRVAGVLTKPFAYNYISGNRGDVILNATGEENLSTQSDYEWNGFYRNEALNTTRKTTIFADNSKHRFVNNYFRNLLNNFELATGNRSYIKKWDFEKKDVDVGIQCPNANYECLGGWTRRTELNACVCYRQDRLVATRNWWGEPGNFYVKTRIWDNSDDNYLINVDFSGAHESNATVLNDAMYCPPTWAFNNYHCFWYIGAPLSHSEAQDFCQYEAEAVLAESRDRVSWMGEIVSTWQNNYLWLNLYSWNTRAWVYSDVPYPGECPVVRNGWLEGYDCNRRVFSFCQKAPYGVYSGVQPEVVIAICILLFLALSAIIIMLILWFIKSSRRAKELIVRRQCLQRLLAPSTMSPSDAGMTSTGGASRGSKSVLSSHVFSSPPGSVMDSALGVPRPVSRHTLVASRETLDRDKVDYPPSKRGAPGFRRPSRHDDFDDPGDESTPLAEAEIPRLVGPSQPAWGVAMKDPTPNHPVRNKPVLTRPSSGAPTSPSMYQPIENDSISTDIKKESTFTDSFSSGSFDRSDPESPGQPPDGDTFFPEDDDLPGQPPVHQLPAYLAPAYQPNPTIEMAPPSRLSRPFAAGPPPTNQPGTTLEMAPPGRLARPPNAGKAPTLKFRPDDHYDERGASVSTETEI